MHRLLHDRLELARKDFACTAAFALSLLVGGTATAATLVATEVDTTDSLNENFTITFTDTNNNRLFDIGELESFSGFINQYPTLLGVPAIAGISVAGELAGVLQPAPGSWTFGSPSGQFASTPNFWTYEIKGLAAIPVPATLPLLLAGLGGLALLRRRARG